MHMLITQDCTSKAPGRVQPACAEHCSMREKEACLSGLAATIISYCKLLMGAREAMSHLLPNLMRRRSEIALNIG